VFSPRYSILFFVYKLGETVLLKRKKKKRRKNLPGSDILLVVTVSLDLGVGFLLLDDLLGGLGTLLLDALVAAALVGSRSDGLAAVGVTVVLLGEVDHGRGATLALVGSGRLGDAVGAGGLGLAAAGSLGGCGRRGGAGAVAAVIVSTGAVLLAAELLEVLAVLRREKVSI